jgi:hypothetical protein
MGADADERAGRWAGSGKVECGIHTFLQPIEAVGSAVESNEPVQS